MFRIQDRSRVRDRVLEIADGDARIVGGAVLGSLAFEEGDRWSDLDLMFAVADGATVADVLEDWTARIADEFAAIRLFDLPVGSTIYRVFLLPGCLQLDLSFAPANEFGPAGPRFRLLFGSAVEKPWVQPPAQRDVFGLAVHHLLRARLCIERDRLWQAEYWISSARDHALTLACARRGLRAHQARGFDDLPPDVLERFGDTLIGSLTRPELLRALRGTTAGLLEEAVELRETATLLEPHLAELTAASLEA